MSFLQDMIDKARGYLGGPPKQAQATDSVLHDRFDAEVFDELLTEAPMLATLEHELHKEFDYAPDLLRDVVMQFWKADPQMRPQGEMRPSHLTNHAAITDIATAPETDNTRQYTRHDRYGAAMAAIGVGEQVTEYLRKHKELQEAAKEAEEAEKGEKQAKDELGQAADNATACGWPGMGPPSPAQEAAKQSLEEAMAKAEEMEAAANAAAQNAAQAAAQAQAELKAPIRAAVKEAAEQLEEEAELFAGWGIEPGEVQRMSFKERADLAQMLRGTRLAKFMDLVGRFKMMQAASRVKKVEYGRDRIVGTELSGDLDRVIGTEMARLAHPVLRRDFQRRFVERQLISRKFEGTEHIGQGAIIALVDSSGSMSTTDNTGIPREVWAKAFTLALLEQARQSRRDFVCINFASRGQQKTWHFPKGQGDIKDVVEMVEWFWNGGTNFAKPLDMAMKILAKDFNTDGKQKADLVFITDGDCGVTPDWMKHYQAERERLAFRTFGICVGDDLGGYYGDVLEALSDNVRTVLEFADPGMVQDILQVIH